MQNPNSEALQAERSSPFRGACINHDEVEWVNEKLNQVTRDIQSWFGQLLIKQALVSFAKRLEKVPSGYLDGNMAMQIIDAYLGDSVSAVKPPKWYRICCESNPDLGWDEEVERTEWEEIRAGLSRYEVR